MPSKEDYWETGGGYPTHHVCQAMPYWRFLQIWKNIHLVPFKTEDEEEPEGEVDPDNEESEDVQPIDDRWYAKSALFIDNVNKVSQQLCKWPSSKLCRRTAQAF